MPKASVAIVILAAGKASRMGEGGKHKLLAEFDDVPLVRRSALTALGADATSVIVVTIAVTFIRHCGVDIIPESWSKSEPLTPAAI
jgi:CTP:molybdopterin cytidylyltransferase MocA